jgi:hemerythrin-like domain-containing protein
MTATRPTDALEQEHRIIQQVVGAMAALADEVEKGKVIPPEVLQNLLEFLRTFADRCHHGKEEACLFPLLERKGVPARGCPLGALKMEHDSGRALVAQLAKASDVYVSGDPVGKSSLASLLRNLVELYSAHIWKEDYLLLPMTNKILSPTEEEALFAEFRRVEADIGRDVHQAFEQLAARLQQGILRD